MANTEMSNYLENKVLDLLLSNTSYTPASTLYLALFTAFAEGGTQTEVSGNAYARTAVTFAAASARATSNSATVNFPEATGSWGTVTHVAVMDASSGGNVLFWGALSASEAVTSGEIFSIDAGDLDINFNTGTGTTIANALIDHILRNQSWTSIPTVYTGLATAFTDTETYTEVSGNAYARTAATFDAAASGATQNSSAVTFPEATGAWGTITHVILADASTSGNVITAVALDSTVSPTSGKTARFGTGDLDVTAN